MSTEPKSCTGRHLVRSSLLDRLTIPVCVSWAGRVVDLPPRHASDDRIPGGGAGDNVTFLWDFWWMRIAAMDIGSRVFWCPYLFAPLGTSLVLHTHLAAPAAAGVALGWLSIQTALNTLLILAVALNGFVAYLLAREYTGTAPSILAGIVFGGAPAIIGRLAGHFNLVNAWMPALFALTWIRLVRGKRIPTALGSGAALALVAYTDYYYLIYSLAFALAWVVLSLWEFRVALVSTPPPVLARIRRAVGVAALGCLGVMAAIWATGGATFELNGTALSLRTVINPATLFWALLVVWLVLGRPFTLHVRPRPERDLWRAVRVAALALGSCGFLMTPILIEAGRLVVGGDYVSQRYFWRSSPIGLDLGTLLLGNPHHAWTAPTSRSCTTVWASMSWSKQLGLDSCQPCSLLLHWRDGGSCSRS